MAKKESTKILKEKLIDYLLAHGWEPNTNYRLDYRENPAKSRITDRGCIDYSYHPYNRKTNSVGTSQLIESYSSEHYLISSDGSYALTVKENIVTVHQASRQFCKVLSLKIADIEYEADGICTGLLKLRNSK